MSIKPTALAKYLVESEYWALIGSIILERVEQLQEEIFSTDSVDMVRRIQGEHDGLRYLEHMILGMAEQYDNEVRGIE